MTIAERIAELEREGFIVPGCPGCEEHYAHYRSGKTNLPWAPLHRALESCKSGGRPHCTCDSCW